MLNELWRDIPYYEGLYQISNYGRVRSFHKNKTKYKTQRTNNRGYLVVQLYKNGKMKNEYVHRLVALTFIPNPNHFPQVNHKDEDKQNNYVENLEWCTAKYNNNYGTARQRTIATSIKNGVYVQSSIRMSGELNPSKQNPKTKGKNSYAKQISCDNKEFTCIKDCAEYYGVSYSSMRVWLRFPKKMPKYFKEHNLHYTNTSTDILPKLG